MYCSWWTGFVEKEIKKANIATVDTGENPEVPFPRDMIDLEVMCSFVCLTSNKFLAAPKPSGCELKLYLSTHHDQGL